MPGRGRLVLPAAEWEDSVAVPISGLTMPSPSFLRITLPAAAVVLALGLVGGSIGQRDRAKRAEAEADLAYLEYRAQVAQERDAWTRYRGHLALRDELIDFADNAARGGNVEQAAAFDRDAEKERLNAEAVREHAEELGAAVTALEEAWQGTWTRYGLELAPRPRP